MQEAKEVELSMKTVFIRVGVQGRNARVVGLNDCCLKQKFSKGRVDECSMQRICCVWGLSVEDGGLISMCVSIGSRKGQSWDQVKDATIFRHSHLCGEG